MKMVHNGIEYGIMAAYAEGLNILHAANAGKTTVDNDAEATPLRDPDLYQYELTKVFRLQSSPLCFYERFSSRGDADFADKLLSAMRFAFGGHREKPLRKMTLDT